MPANSVTPNMTTAHTPAPWSLMEYQVSGDPCVDRKLRVVRDVPNEPVADICEINEDLINNEAMGNARLIVAAVNACGAINPKNPIAVAEAIRALFNAATRSVDATTAEDAEQARRRMRAAIYAALDVHSARDANNVSALPCGCDPGAAYTCEQHRGTDVRA